MVGFDVGLPCTGLAVWHINTSKTTTAHIDANDVNADENLKGVDLEEADGNLDLDNNTNRGETLQVGKYFLHLLIGGKTFKQQIMVER